MVKLKFISFIVFRLRVFCVVIGKGLMGFRMVLVVCLVMMLWIKLGSY